MRHLLRDSRYTFASLRMRLLAGTLIWIVLSVALAGWGLSKLFREHITQQFQAELTIHMNQLISLLTVDSDGKLSMPVALSDPRLDQPFSGLYWQVDQLAGDTLDEVQGVLRSRSLWDQTLRTDADSKNGFYTLSGPDSATITALVRTILPAETPNRPLRVIVAADQNTLAEPVGRFTRMLVLSLGALVVGLSLAAVFQVWSGLLPLAKLRRQLVDVREGKALQIEGRFPIEVQPLVDNFNAVLSLNSGLVERARTQAGNLAHAVKTPLTVLGNAAQNEPSTLGSLVLEQVGIARRQIDHHLPRARAAAAVQANGLRVPLKEPLESLIRVMRKVHAQRDLIIVLHEVPESAVFRGDLQDLHEMVGNLLDNACKWARHRVELCVAVESTGMVLSIQDDGPGLAPQKRELIFQRGVRMDERTPGSGLGLAIVRDLAQLYGGDVYAQGAEMGGLNVILRLPLA